MKGEHRDWFWTAGWVAVAPTDEGQGRGVTPDKPYDLELCKLALLYHQAHQEQNDQIVERVAPHRLGLRREFPAGPRRETKADRERRLSEKEAKLKEGQVWAFRVKAEALFLWAEKAGLLEEAIFQRPILQRLKGQVLKTLRDLRAMEAAELAWKNKVASQSGAE